MSNKSLAFCQISFNWTVKNVFHEPKGTSWRKIFSKKIDNNWVFNSFLDFDQKKNRHSGKLFLTGFKKLHFTYLQIYFEENCLKKTFLCCFWTTIKFFFRCKTQYSTSPQERSNQVFFGINVYFLLFRFLSENFRHFFKRLPTGLSKLNPSCPQETLEEKYFFWKNCRCSYRFQKLAKKKGLLTKTFRQVCENCFWSVYRIILR